MDVVPTARGAAGQADNQVELPIDCAKPMDPRFVAIENQKTPIG